METVNISLEKYDILKLKEQELDLIYKESLSNGLHVFNRYQFNFKHRHISRDEAVLLYSKELKSTTDKYNALKSEYDTLQLKYDELQLEYKNEIQTSKGVIDNLVQKDITNKNLLNKWYIKLLLRITN